MKKPVSQLPTETLLAELENRGVLSIARELHTYIPTEKEKLIANGVAYSVDDSRKLLQELLAMQYAYERIALENQSTYKLDSQYYENLMDGDDVY